MTDVRLQFVVATVLVLATVYSVPVRGQDEHDLPEIDALLDAGALAEQPNPVVLEFLLSDGRQRLTETQYRQAFDQVTAALRERTLVSIFGAAGDGETPSYVDAAKQATEEKAKEAVSPGNILRRGLGLPSASSQPFRRHFQATTHGMLIDPWVRGLAAARALARAGFEDEAAQFYRRCLSTPVLAASAGNPGARQIAVWSGWVRARCEQGLVAMGLPVAGPIFGDLADRGQPDLGPGMDQLLAMARAMNSEKGRKQSGPAIEPMPEVRAAGFSGIAALLESGELSARQRSGVVEAALILVDRPKRKLDDFATAAGARTLGAAADPKAEKVLRKLGKREKKFPQSTWAAREALAAGYGDAKAIRWLEKRLKGGDSSDNWDAFEILMELDHPTAWQWAGKQLDRGSVPRNQTDWRGTLIQRFALADTERSFELLHAARKPEAQEENYQQALLAVALFQRGDRDLLPEIAAAMERENWDLGRRATGQWWRMIKPLLKAGAMAAAGLPPDQDSVRQLVTNFAFGAYEQHRAQERAEAASSNTLRFRAAAAVAEWDDPRTLPLIDRLLESEHESTRLAAARALLGQTSPEALPFIDRALDLDYGSERGASRTPEIHAALLLHALRGFGNGSEAGALVGDANRFSHPSVQFLAAVIAG